MIKKLPQIPISEENEFQNQFYSWLNNSHYWVEQSSTVCVCKWCNIIMPIELERSVLCKNNPEILKIKTNETT